MTEVGQTQSESNNSQAVVDSGNTCRQLSCCRVPQTDAEGVLDIVHVGVGIFDGQRMKGHCTLYC